MVAFILGTGRVHGSHGKHDGFARKRARLYSQHGGGLMNRQLMLFLATAVFSAFLLSGTPAAAQGQGQGTFGVDTCEPAKTQCPSGAPNAFGVCVAFADVCTAALRTA